MKLLASLRHGLASLWSCLIFAFYTIYLATALTLPDVEKPIAGLLLLLGWVGLYRFKKHSYALNVTEKYMLFSFALFSVVSIISFLVMPQSRVGQMHLEDYGVFIMIIPLFLLLRQFRLNVNIFLYVIAIVLIGLGIQSYLSVDYRPSGGVNVMRFANVTLILSLFLLIALVILRGQSKSVKVFLFLAVCFGMFACIAAQSRGALLSIPIIFVAFSIYFYRKGDSRLLLIVLLSGSLSMAYLSQLPFVKVVHSNAERYLEGDPGSALGARLDMFKVAFILIEEKPVFGHGLGSYSAEASKIRNRTPGMNHEVGVWNNPHNEILQVMVEKGIIGLLTLILIFLAPAYSFIIALKRLSGRKHDLVIKFYAISGLGLLLVYAIAGQTVALFEHDVFNHFYILMVILFASQIRVHEYYFQKMTASEEH